MWELCSLRGHGEQLVELVCVGQTDRRTTAVCRWLDDDVDDGHWERSKKHETASATTSTQLCITLAAAAAAAAATMSDDNDNDNHDDDDDDVDAEPLVRRV